MTAADVRTHGDHSFGLLISLKKVTRNIEEILEKKRKMNQYLCFDTWE